MALQDTAALVIQVDTASSFPNPNSVAQRQHQVFNTGVAAVALTSVGANPFLVGGVNAASVNVAAGASILMQSNGAQWVVTANDHRAFFAATGVTNAAGDVTFAFPVGLFSVAPVIDLAFQGAANASPVDYRITALSATSCTVNVRQSLATVIALLGLTLLAASLPLSGATIHLIATSPGGSP